MLTLIVLISAVCFAGVRWLTFVYYKKHDMTLEQIDQQLAGRFQEGSHESQDTRTTP
ncbi:hypothetical protein [Paenibacillus silviterrae]|uniref:hypothetical protein n=1 Tax=Paenibacillus silviterrae TaxID=3242194 RepID=UPI002543F1D7|nr:hypothetical protein [Paenibacillus chinjuensis]